MVLFNMTSREKVLKALNSQTRDRVPIDMGGFQTGIHKIELISAEGKPVNFRSESTKRFGGIRINKTGKE